MISTSHDANDNKNTRNNRSCRNPKRSSSFCYNRFGLDGGGVNQEAADQDQANQEPEKTGIQNLTHQTPHPGNSNFSDPNDPAGEHRINI